MVLSTDWHVDQIYPRLLTAFTSVTIGFGFYLSKFPERVPALGRLEGVQLFVNSHVFWHLFVVVCEYNLY